MAVEVTRLWRRSAPEWRDRNRLHPHVPAFRETVSAFTAGSISRMRLRDGLPSRAGSKRRQDSTDCLGRSWSGEITERFQPGFERLRRRPVRQARRFPSHLRWCLIPGRRGVAPRSKAEVRSCPFADCDHGRGRSAHAGGGRTRPVWMSQAHFWAAGSTSGCLPDLQGRPTPAGRIWGSARSPWRRSSAEVLRSRSTAISGATRASPRMTGAASGFPPSPPS